MIKLIAAFTLLMVFGVPAMMGWMAYDQGVQHGWEAGAFFAVLFGGMMLIPWFYFLQFTGAAFRALVGKEG